MAFSEHHIDVPWCVVGPISIFYHANMTQSIQVSYDERSVFGSHGQYAVWLGTSPRSLSVWATMVGANAEEVNFNVQQVINAWNWTQENPPSCKTMVAPAALSNADLNKISVRTETFESNIEEATMTHGTTALGNAPIQITLNLTLKECKPI